MINIIKAVGWANITHRPGRPKTYIAIHYTAGVSSKKGVARAVAWWFGQTKAQASADFICDDVETVQYNPDIDNYSCWAVGGSRYNTRGGRLFGVAFNCNTISIEICSTNDTGRVTEPNDGHWHFTDAAVERAVELTKWLMQKYGINADHVIRHYDVNGKPCPGIKGWNADTGDESAWIAFKKRIQEDDEMLTYDQFKDYMRRYEAEKAAAAPSDYAKDSAKKAVEAGLFMDGDGDGSLDNPRANLTREQFATVLDRAGLLDKAEALRMMEGE